MKNYLVMALAASFIGIMVNPEMLVASDSVRLNGINGAGIVETAILEPEKPAFEAEEPDFGLEETRYFTATAFEPVYEEYYSYAPVDSFQIAGMSLPLSDTAYVDADAGDGVLRYSDYYYYGHNSWDVFGVLNDLYDVGALVGTGFSITYEGETQYYTVSAVQEFSYDAVANRLQIGGVGNYMSGVVSGAWGHRVAIMTCYGAGDTGRLVVFGD